MPGMSLDAYDSRFATRVHSPTRVRIRQEVYGDEFPVDASGNNYATVSELRRMARELQVGTGQTLVDLGCGYGGPGSWIARETGAAVVGVDLSETFTQAAPERAASLDVAERATFITADITDTGLPAASFDAAMSIDVLWAVPDKPAAIGECARLLKPGARFVFTTWDREEVPPGYLPAFSNHRPALEAAGFVIDAYDIQEGAEELRRAVYERVVAAEQELIRELGVEATEKIMFEAKGNLSLIDAREVISYSRRIFVVATRTRRMAS